MAGHFPLCREGSAERGQCNMCWSGRGPGDMGKEDEEVNLYARDEVSPGEHWFNQENTRPCFGWKGKWTPR